MADRMDAPGPDGPGPLTPTHLRLEVLWSGGAELANSKAKRKWRQWKVPGGSSESKWNLKREQLAVAK